MDKNKIEDFEKKINATMNQINPMMEKIVVEVRKINTPKKKKEAKILGESVIVSLVEDGRVIVKFATTESSEKFFNEIDQDQSNVSIWKKIFKK